MRPLLSDKGRRLRNSCDFCTYSKLRCNGEKPACRRCLGRDQPCIYSPARRPGRPAKDILKAGGGCATVEHSAVQSTGGCLNPRSPRPSGQGERRSSATPQASADGFHFQAMELETAEQIHTDSVSFMDLGLLDDDDNNLFGFSITETLREADGYITSPRPTADEGLYGLVAATPASVTLSEASIDNSAGKRQNHISAQALIEQANQSCSRGASERTTYSGSQRTLPSPDELRNTYDEDSTFSQIDRMINALSSRVASGPGVCAEPQHYSISTCSCAAFIGRLQVSVLHPALSSHKSSIPLDLLLFLEGSIFQTHKSISECLTCRPYSLHSLASVCISTDWVTDALRTVVHSYTSAGPAPEGPGKTSSTDEWCAVRVGGLALDGNLWQKCVQALIKRRLSRFICVISGMAGLDQGGGGSLRQAVGLMLRDIHQKMESLLGMIELWESCI